MLGRGLGRVLGDLAESGYDAEWDVLPAAAFGCEHIRERVFIVAYPECKGLERSRIPNIFASKDTRRLVSVRRLSESDVVRKRNAVPNYVDRIRGLGNAVVPQVAEWIGRRIVELEDLKSKGE